MFIFQLIWKRVKKSGHQVAYDQDDSFNALVRRLSALPFTKHEDMDEAFALFKLRADKLEPKLKEFCHELISYAQTQWRERFAIQDWNLFSINCLLVPSTNNGNEGANGRFLTDFGVHPPFWNFCLAVNDELMRVNNDIPSILYGSQRPKENPLYHVLKEEREVTKANYEAGLINLDGYLGKMGAISLTTGKSYSSDEMDQVQKRKKNDNLEDRLDDERPVSKKRKVISAIPGRRGRPAKNICKPIASSSAEVPPLISTEASVSSSATPANVSSVSSIPTPLLSHLPWPEQQGLQAIPSALPATSSRTTASAIPSTISSGLSSAPVSLSSIGLFNNSLTEHINKYDLGLKERASIPGDGNCWFTSNCDLARLYGLKSPDDPNELRLAVANVLQNHPKKVQWIRSLFNGKTRSFNRFIKEHSVPGKFIDNFGLFVLATGEYLNVKYHIVGTSNNAKDPVTILDYAENSDVVMHLGYYQDNTDGVGEKRQAGHYQSLEPIPNKAIPCCKIGPSRDDAVHGVANDDNDGGAVFGESVVRNDEMILTEEKILKTFSDDHKMVELSLIRLTKMCVSLDDLFSTNISCILYNEIRSKYPATSKIGKLSRKLLLRYQRLCRADPEFDDELPNVTVVAEDEDESTMVPKKKSFRSLFSGRRASIVIAQSGAPTSIPDVDISTSARARASSTVIEQLEPQLEEDSEPEVHDYIESPVHLNFEPARRKSVQSRKRKNKPAKSTIFDRTDSQILLTPPPPTSPVTPPRRGRGRPRIDSQLVLTPPPPTSPATPPRRGRGRPRKAITLDSLTQDVMLPPKKGRGRPKKT